MNDEYKQITSMVLTGSFCPYILSIAMFFFLFVRLLARAMSELDDDEKKERG